MNSVSLISFPRRALAGATLALAAVLLFAPGCAKSHSAAAVAVKPVLVQLAPIEYSTAAIPVRATGLLSRKTEADLSFKVGGVVEAVFVRSGDAVTQGQVLARLRLDEIEAQVTQAQSALDKTQRLRARLEKLHAEDAVSAEAWQDAQTAADQAAAQLRIAEFDRRYAVITAPADGRVLRRLAEPNELVAAGRAILGFGAEADGWLVRVGLSDRDVMRVHVGDRATITINCDQPRTVTGRVTHIGEATEASTRTTTVEITLDAEPCEARSGFVVATTIQPQPVASRTVVPATALVEGAADSASVFVVDANTHAARRVAVEVETLFDTAAYLRTRLPRTGRLVVTGAEYLRDGTAVEAVR